MSLTQLPDEILLEIFKFLPITDLLSLTLTCKAYNHLISSSTSLLEKFELQLVLKNFKREWICTRKYSSIFIDSCAARFFLYIVSLIGKDIKSMIFNCDDNDAVIVKNILLMCPNVRKIWLYNFVKEADFYPDEHGDPRPSYELDFLYFQGAVELMKILQNCTAKKLEVRRYRVNHVENPSTEHNLTKFLARQNNLTDLRLHYFHDTSDLTSDNSLNHVNFKLKKLRFKFFDSFTSNSFIEFLSNFKDSLTHLEVEKCHHDILDLFTSFKNLKNLTIYHFCSRFSPILSVENLTVGYLDGNFTGKFPNTKNLTIYHEVENIQQIINFKYLKTLKIVDFELPELIFPPSLKKLTLHRVTLRHRKPFNYDENEIEEIEIFKCKDCDWLIDFLTICDIKLKKLEIVKSILSEECRRAISESLGVIKCVRVVNCGDLSEEELESASDTSSIIADGEVIEGGDEEEGGDREEGGN